MNLVRKVPAAEKNQVATQKMSKSGFFWNDKESRFSLIVEQIHKHVFQADSDRRSIQELSGTIDSQRREIDHTHACDEQLRRDQQLLHEQLSEQNRDHREAHMKSLNEMDELKRFQGSTFGTIARRKLIKDRDTILELTAKIQELHNEVNCMNGSRDFKDAESHWTIPRSQSTCVFPTFSRSWRNAKPFSRNAEPQRYAAKHLGHAWYIGNVCNRAFSGKLLQAVVEHLHKENLKPQPFEVLCSKQTIPGPSE